MTLTETGIEVPCLIRSERPARGRRPISDYAALELMTAFWRIAHERGELISDRALARQAVEYLALTGASLDALEDRLRKKFRRLRAGLSCGPEFRPKKPRADREIPAHPQQHSGEDSDVYVGLLRDVKVAGPEHEPGLPSGSRATVRVVNAPPWKDRPQDPPLLISVRLATAPDAMVEHRIAAAVARELAVQLTNAIADYDRRVAAAHPEDQQDG